MGFPVPGDLLDPDAGASASSIVGRTPTKVLGSLRLLLPQLSSRLIPMAVSTPLQSHRSAQPRSRLKWVSHYKSAKRGTSKWRPKESFLGIWIYISVLKKLS